MKLSDFDFSSIDTKFDPIKIMSLLAYIGPFFLVGLIINFKKKTPSLWFHINQGFILFMVEIVMGVMYYLIGLIPFAGAILGYVFRLVAIAVVLVYVVIGIIHVVLSVLRPLPYFGDVKIFK